MTRAGIPSKPHVQLIRKTAKTAPLPVPQLKQVPIKFDPLPQAGEIKMTFVGSDLVRLVKEGIVASFADTGHVCFVRLKFCRPGKPSVVSKDSKPVFLIWHGGAALAHIEMRGRRWARAVKPYEPIILFDCPMPYRVEVGVGDVTPENLDEVFYFPDLPPEIASLKSETAKLEWLQKDCVADLLERESKELEAKRKQLEAEQLRTTPARLPHEDKDVDHYVNWRQAMEKLLCKKWPNLSIALKALAMANNEEQKLRVLAAYAADYKVIFGKPPDVKTEDKAELWADPYYIGLMNKALSAGGSPVDAVVWQLGIGWLTKGYYQMNETQLEAAFKQDWNGKPGQYKGNTLARYARDKIGLIFALKRGRPEKHKFDDSTLSGE
jgi:hypothetical protein